jgi:anti-sigma regulatory factor (Ser/Thr protein kinase)
MAPAGAFKVREQEPAVIVKAPGLANYSNIRRALKQLEPILRDCNPHRVIFDMTSIRQCSATGVTILAAAMQHLYQSGRLHPDSEILPPQRQWIRSYFEEMKFFRELGVELGPPPRIGKRRRFWPVTHVSNDKESPGLTRRILNQIASYEGVHPDARNSLTNCVNEIIENVFYHASSPIDALVAGQSSPQTGKTELVIADTGRGIRPGLSSVPAYRERTQDDCSAIRLALERNVSAIEDKSRGIGLWLASELVRRNGGQLLILSNEGGIDISGHEEKLVEGFYWPGTLVAVEFDILQPITTTEIYDSGDFPDIDEIDLGETDAISF